MIDLRLPNITAQTPEGQLQQMRSYLYQMAEQLNWALKTMDSGGSMTAGRPGAAAADESKSPTETFNSIKALIIKSADIVSAYSDIIYRRLSGDYVAVSDFGTYQEETSQEIEENATSIQQAFTNIQSIVSSMENIESILVGVNAYINSGLLYYDEGGAAVYGIEVGQRTEVNGEETFNKYARFTANKLSFYDSNDNEVAYISDYKLYISNVEISGSFRQGHLVSTVQADGSIVRRYEGG